MFLDVEGETRRECMRILRHEAGHIIQHAYALNRRRKWQDTFGRSSTRYPALLPSEPGQQGLRPASAALVRAEPSGRGFRRDVRGVADAALELAHAAMKTGRRWRSSTYVDELMAEIAEERPTLTRRTEVDPRPQAHQDAAPSTTRRSSTSIRRTSTRGTTATCSASSPDEPRHRNSVSASAFIRSNRAADPRGRFTLVRRLSGGARCDPRPDDRSLPCAEAARAGTETRAAPGAGPAALHQGSALALPRTTRGPGSLL